MADELTAPSAATRAARAATQIDRARISVRAGLIAAVPVIAVLAIGMAIGQPVAAVTMGAGAMLSGVAWRGGGGTLVPPLGTMTAAAAGLVVATAAGTLSGHLPWLHLGLLVVFCLVAGLLATLGRRGNVVGIQSVIAFVVFGRFSEGLAGAFTLAGLVLLGGAAQIAVAATVARPATWRQQRAAVAGAYRSLAALAANPGSSTVAAAAALDDAELRLSGPALFADHSAMTLGSLVDEGRRIRLELIALSAAASDQGENLSDPLDRVSQILDLVAGTIESGGGLDSELDAQADLLRSRMMARGAAEARLAALAGQVGAAARLTTQSTRPQSLRHVAHPTRGSRLPLAQLPSDLRRLRASATVRSATGRHAIRLAVAVAGTELLVQLAGLPRGYWAVIAAATVLRPEFSATFTRGAERMLGTAVGVVGATLIAVALAPGGWGIVIIVGFLAWATYAVFPASFAAGTAGITAVVVFLLHPVAPSSVSIALDRGVDAVIGGAIGLAVYAAWPTWSGRSAEPLLADVVEAQREYLAAVLGHVAAGTSSPEAEREFRPLARSARIAYSDAEAAVTLTQSEPRRGADPGVAASTLVALRRLVYAIHTLRVDLRTTHDPRPMPQLLPLARALQEAFAQVRERLRSGNPPPSPYPPLRGLYREAMAVTSPDDAERVAGGLDEMIDALNTAAAGLGLELS